VSLSVDRKRLVDAALAGFATIASGPVPPENPLALTDSVQPAIAMADSLLDAAGWRRAADGVRARDGRPFVVELLTVGSGDNAVEQLLQADLAARGIHLVIRQMELAAFLARARATPKSFDMLVTGIPGDLSLSYLSAMYDSRERGSAVDYADYHSAVLDALFVKARDARTPAELRDAWQTVQRQLLAEAPAAWLFHSRGLQGMSARMRNVRMDLRGELATVGRWTIAEDRERRMASR
jgi:peptide/nickel transport system substrate-binding protein